MNYKDEMRKLIELVKQQGFDAPLENTLEDLTTLSTVVKDLSDRITTRTQKSLNPNDKAYEHRKISVAVTRKKKTAIDAISNVVEGKFG